jgi:trk system potassium uptake protein TrkA
MDIIIAGDGEVGFHLARSLSKIKHNITVVDPHSELLNMLQADSDLLTIAGNSTSIETLKEAGVASCDLLISVLHEESINLMTCILGKRLGAKRCIARVSTLEYLNEENKSMFKGLGVDEMVCPERIAAKEITNLLTRNTATEIFDFSNGLLLVYMMRLDKNALLLNKTMAEMGQLYPNLEARAICIIRKGKTIIPAGPDMYMKDDLVYLIAKPESIEKIKELGGKRDYQIKNAMILGGGRIGKRAALNLQNDIDFLSKYSSFNNNVDFAGRMVYNEKGEELINFGKYKGRLVKEVLKSDPSYYAWIMNGDFTLNTKKILTEIKLRDLKSK